ncbi:Mitochondrial cardiolipin hydrolase [Myotis brandtii]|uniref:Mitochondrial cardiolipin hydrolase n=1 Tax=Myotis brandtii TaxID=109478 RepID=S7MZS7_MYOBR|nr:Mitochondrial cardiolipin hydrolase [Myotis brandtii]
MAKHTDSCNNGSQRGSDRTAPATEKQWPPGDKKRSSPEMEMVKTPCHASSQQLCVAAGCQDQTREDNMLLNPTPRTMGGQSGLGKSTLVNTLFKSQVSRKASSWNREEKIPKTVEIKAIGHGIQVRHDQDLGYMHHKFAIVDKKVLITGSLNWTTQAIQNNRENVLIMEDEDYVRLFLEEFEHIWEEFNPTKYPFSPQKRRSH